MIKRTMMVIFILVFAFAVFAECRGCPETEKKSEKKKENKLICKDEQKKEININEQERNLSQLFGKGMKLKFHYETGFVGVLKHTIQFGLTGTKFDYVNEGGQDILFPFERFSADIYIKRNIITLLYQPLDIRTDAVLRRDVIVDGTLFPSGTPMNLRYGFDFYRVSYMYNFAKKKDCEAAFGASFQIRNAAIAFSSKDGTLSTVNQNIGPVPILKFRTHFPIKNGFWFGSEIDGFYADGRYITGSKDDFKGAILDATLRAGYRIMPFSEAFLGFRYIGGGAFGQQDNPEYGDGFADNWIHTFSISLGLSLI